MSERMCVETGCPVMIHGGSVDRCIEHAYARLEQGEALLRDIGALYTRRDGSEGCRYCMSPLELGHGTMPCDPLCVGRRARKALAPASPVAHPSWCGKPSTMAPSEIVWCKEHEPVATCRGTGRVLDSGFGDHVARLAQESGRDISIRPENFTKPCPGCTDCRGPTSGAADPVAPLPHHDASDHAAWANLCAHPECVAKVAGPVAPSTGGRAHKLRLKLFEMRDAREVTSAAGFELTTEAKAKLYDIQQDIVRAAIAADDLALDPPPPSGGTSAGRCRGTGWTQQGSISCPGCPHCRPTTCRYSNVDCPGPAFCTAAACRPIPTTGGDLRDPSRPPVAGAGVRPVELLHAAVGYGPLKCKRSTTAAGSSQEHSELCMALQVVIAKDRAARLEASPVDPVAAVLSVECPVHARPGFPCFNSAGGFTGYCASRIRAAVATPLQGER